MRKRERRTRRVHEGGRPGRVAVVLQNEDCLVMGEHQIRVTLRQEHALRADTPPQMPASSVAADQSVLLAAFAQGLGVSVEDINRIGAEGFLRRAGGLLRQSMQAMVSNAQARANLKSELRLDMTPMTPRTNNPIKFSAHGDQVVGHLLARDHGYFMPVEDAVQECSEDFLQHQIAVMAAMQQVLQELLQQLSPEALEQRFEGGKGRGLGFSSKAARNWEAYCELHREWQAEEDVFASLFAESFASAYDEQIGQLKSGKKG